MSYWISMVGIFVPFFALGMSEVKADSIDYNFYQALAGSRTMPSFIAANDLKAAATRSEKRLGTWPAIERSGSITQNRGKIHGTRQQPDG